MEPATLEERDAETTPCEVVAASAPLAPLQSSALEVNEFAKLRALEDKIHTRALTCLEDVSHWVDVDEGTQEPPQAWVDELGLEAARKRLRVAKSGWMSAKEAPVGIKVAQTVAVGIAKARAVEKGGGTSLSVQQVIFNAPVYEVIEVASEDG